VRLPVWFEAADGDGFAVRTGRGTYYLTASGGLRLSPRLEMRLAGGVPALGSYLSNRLPGYTNDFRGNDPARWRTGVPQYGRVRFARVYPGIDLVFHGEQTELEYDFEVAPGVSPGGIVLEFDGAESVRLGSSGELIVHAPGDDVRFLRPRVLQEGKPIRGAYRLLGGNRVGFRVGRYDRSRALVIDPVLGYAARFGSQGGDPIQALAVDATGNIYIAGTTTGAVPLLNPINPKPGAGNCSQGPGFMQCQDVFVAKFDPTGANLLYSTYLGGDTRDFAAGIAVDAAGNAYVVGTTRAVDNTMPRAWVKKLNPSGSAILYNSNIAGDTTASAVAVDAQGDAYLAGTSLALAFPAVNALEARAPTKSLLATHDGGVTWLSPDNNLAALTVYSLAIDPSGAKLYAATVSGLFRSIDAGATWTQIFPAAQVARVVVLDPSNPSTLYVLYGDSVYNMSQIAKSTDAGTTWQILTGALPPPKFPAPFRSFGAVVLDPSNSAVLWLTETTIGSQAIYQSVDGGAHWTDVHDFQPFYLSQEDSLSPDPDAAGILVDPKNSSRVYVCCAYSLLGGSASGVFRTDDGGKTWVEGGHGPTSGSSGIWPPVLDPHDAGVLYASWFGGLVRSGDAGLTWTAVNLPPSAPAAAPYDSGSLAIDPSGALYLVNENGGLFRRSADGTTWTTIQGPWTQGAGILALDPVNPSSSIYVGSPLTGVEHAFAAKLDPAGSILWATLLAGSLWDEAHAIAVDSAGSAYVAGRTNSLDFPLANPVQAVRGKAPAGGLGFDAFLGKISTDGKKLVYSTYLGGSSDDAANAIAVDSAGAAYIAGSTTSLDFPTVNAIQAVPGSSAGGSFVAKVDSTGGKLLYSTYLSGTGGWPFTDAATSIAVDAQGSAWVAGQTGATGFPLVLPIQSSLPPGVAAYIAKLVPSGTGTVLGFSTYIGGNFDSIAALAVSPTGSIWVAGTASSPDFIGSATFGSGGFLARLDLEPLAPAAPGIPLVRAVYNAASMRLGDVVSPGQIVSIFGAELAPAAGSATGFPLPQSLQGVTVTVGGIAAPLFYVSPSQINFQVPFEVAQGATSIVVNRGSGSPLVSAVVRSVFVIPATPGIFTASGDGYNSPVVVHTSDYTQVTPQNSAHAGEFLAIFCTGLGAVNGSVRAGDAASAAPVQPSFEVVVDSALVGSAPYAGLAPGFAGLYQVNFQVSANETPGVKLLYVDIWGVASNQVPLYVK
jgi:uncharacterized protein (TIGR03437 family)